eukprot:328339-Prorocentrum_minimum.AAC.1
MLAPVVRTRPWVSLFLLVGVLTIWGVECILAVIGAGGPVKRSVLTICGVERILAVIGAGGPLVVSVRGVECTLVVIGSRGP